MDIANTDTWTCPGCQTSVGRQHNESIESWQARRRWAQMSHGIDHPTQGVAR